jgi:hypothetical protein
MWGCSLEGVVLVPIDYRASADFLLRVASIVDARAVLVGDAGDRERSGVATDLARVGVEEARQKRPIVPPKPSLIRTPTAERGRHRRNHLHLRRNGTAQSVVITPPQHPGEHRPIERAGREIKKCAETVSARFAS